MGSKKEPRRRKSSGNYGGNTEFPNLEIIPVEKETALTAIQLIRKYNLVPRDSLHAATAMAEKVDFIVTADAYFVKVKELTVKELC